MSPINRKTLSKRMLAYFARKAQNLEDNGNPAAAEEYRRRWNLLPTDVPEPKKERKKGSMPRPDPVESLPKRESMLARAHRLTRRG